MDVVMRQEQHFLNNRSYGTTLASLGLPDPLYVDKTSEAVSAGDPQRVYQVTLANTSNTAYDAVATPLLDQLEDACGTFTLTSTGVKTASGAAGSDACW
jgi:type IV pilus assembly protein PilE